MGGWWMTAGGLLVCSTCEEGLPVNSCPTRPTPPHWYMQTAYPASLDERRRAVKCSRKLPYQISRGPVLEADECGPDQLVTSADQVRRGHTLPTMPPLSHTMS